MLLKVKQQIMRSIFLTTLFLIPFISFSQSFTLAKELKNDGIDVHNRNISNYGFGGVELDAQQSDGLAILKNASFKTGTIELEIKGENNPGKSFVGFAFNIQDEETYESIYFRPFNFVAEAPARRSHMVQYIHHPEFTWSKLREERTDEFENEIQSPPNPDGWFKAKLVIDKASVRVFILDREVPELTITRLTTTTSNKVGLWTGFGSSGRFRNLKITSE